MDLKSTTSTAQSATWTVDPSRRVAPAGTPSGGWKGFAGRRNGPISATGKPAEPLAATARLYLARNGSNLSSLEPAARTMWTATGPTNCAIPSCTP